MRCMDANNLRAEEAEATGAMDVDCWGSAVDDGAVELFNEA